MTPLERFGRHTSRCAANVGDEPDCNCGLNAAIEAESALPVPALDAMAPDFPLDATCDAEQQRLRGEAAERRVAELEAAVRAVLDDTESQHPGGWGPDVTTVEFLRRALLSGSTESGDPR